MLSLTFYTPFILIKLILKVYNRYKFMKLLIKQRVFSWNDTYDVFDEFETPKYSVRSEFFSIGHVIHIFDHNNVEIACIREKVLTFFPTFYLELHGNSIGCIRKEFNLFTPKYKLDCNNWKIDGDFLGWNYTICSGNTIIMNLSKEPFHWGDTYVLDFPNPEHELMGLLIVIAIDAANCSK